MRTITTILLASLLDSCAAPPLVDVAPCTSDTGAVTDTATADTRILTKPIRVAAVGDSITAGYGAPSPTVQSYPAVMQGLLGADYSVENEGHSGATLAWKGGIYSYWKTQEWVRSYAWVRDGGIAVIMLGTNDKRYTTITNADILSDCIELIHFYQSHAVVFVALSPPTHDVATAARMEEIVILQRTCAMTAGVTVIDTHKPFVDNPALLAADGHPTVAGYKVIAEIVAGSIRE